MTKKKKPREYSRGLLISSGNAMKICNRKMFGMLLFPLIIDCALCPLVFVWTAMLNLFAVDLARQQLQIGVWSLTTEREFLYFVSAVSIATGASLAVFVGLCSYARWNYFVRQNGKNSNATKLTIRCAVVPTIAISLGVTRFLYIFFGV